MTGARESGQGRVEWRKGGRVGEFTLLDKLGQGSMGVVYFCEHVETRGRYALKALSAQASSVLVKRFEREGQAQAAVDAHPNVLRVHSAGQAGGYRYLVMDLAEGGDLEVRLRGGALPPLEAARIVVQLAEGLRHVHALGVLHRDLKPSNVLFDGDGVPKLVDFGLATLEGSEGLTQAGDLIGTPVYMAPEQAAGRKRDVDERSDVYGLGAILYHALTGQRPFDGKTTHDVVKRVITEAPPKPRALVPTLPATLEAICLRAMAKDKDARYANAGEFRDALGAFLENPDASGVRVPLGVVALLGVTAVFLLGLFGTAVLGLSDSSEPAATLPVADPQLVEAPTPSEPDGLTWALREGSIVRCSLEHSLEVTQPEAEQARWERGGFKAFTRIGWTWTVLSAAATRIELEATIHSLTVRRESAYGGNVDFDSSTSQEDNPYARALGGVLRLELEATTGEVLSVEGAESIQDAVNRGVVELSREMQRWSYQIPQFESSVSMRNTLNQLFYVLPGT
jgi:serine/threonine protein kinase